MLSAADATASGQRGRPPAPGLQRLLLKLLGIGIGAAAVPGAMLVLTWPEPIPGIATTLVIALAGWRAVAALADFMLAPRRAAQRLWPAGDAEERRVLKRRVVGIAGAVAAGAASSSILQRAFGAPALAELMEAAAAALVAAIVLGAVAAWSRERRRSGLARRSLADVLPFGTAALTVACLALWLSGQSEQLAETIAILSLRLTIISARC